MSVGQALLRADEVWEFDAVTDEENRRIVADNIVVPFAGVELQSEAAYITPSVRRPQFSRDRRETSQHLCLDTRLKERSSCIAANILGDGQGTEGTAALGVYNALRYLKVSTMC